MARSVKQFDKEAKADAVWRGSVLHGWQDRWRLIGGNGDPPGPKKVALLNKIRMAILNTKEEICKVVPVELYPAEYWEKNPPEVSLEMLERWDQLREEAKTALRDLDGSAEYAHLNGLLVRMDKGTKAGKMVRDFMDRVEKVRAAVTKGDMLALEDLTGGKPGKELSNQLMRVYMAVKEKDPQEAKTGQTEADAGGGGQMSMFDFM